MILLSSLTEALVGLLEGNQYQLLSLPRNHVMDEFSCPDGKCSSALLPMK